jgi:hypothetical protein
MPHAHNSHVLLPILYTPGGVAGAGSAGRGGTSITIIATTTPTSTVTITGVINVNGVAGATSGGCGGGGAGGSIAINASVLVGGGTLTARGGQGGSSSCTSWGGAGSGGRIAIHAVVMSYTGNATACGGIGLSTFGAGGPGTVLYNTIGAGNRTLVIDNCGYTGMSAMLAEPGRQLYELDTVRVTSRASLSAVKPSSAAGDRVAVVIEQLSGDRTGRIVAGDGVDVTILGASGNNSDSSPVVTTSTTDAPYSVVVDVSRVYFPSSIIVDTALIANVGGSIVLPGTLLPLLSSDAATVVDTLAFVLTLWLFVVVVLHARGNHHRTRS